MQMSMTTFGRSVYLKGELRTSEDLTVEGRIEGPVLCEDGAIVVAPGGQIAGDVLARDVTIFGRMDRTSCQAGTEWVTSGTFGLARGGESRAERVSSADPGIPRWRRPVPRATIRLP